MQKYTNFWNKVGPEGKPRTFDELEKMIRKDWNVVNVSFTKKFSGHSLREIAVKTSTLFEEEKCEYLKEFLVDMDTFDLQNKNFMCQSGQGFRFEKSKRVEYYVVKYVKYNQTGTYWNFIVDDYYHDFEIWKLDISQPKDTVISYWEK
jgi:hypothetical protein